MMGRSSKQEAALNRARIVEKASELFLSHGVEAVSVANVMGTLGLTTGGFYKHFASKEALAAEAVDLAFGQLTSSWQTAAGPDNEATASRRANLVAYYLRPAPNWRCPMIAFAPHVGTAEVGEETRDCYRRGVEVLFESFMGTAENTDDTTPAPDTDRGALVLFAAMVGARVLKEAVKDATWATALRDAVLDAAEAQARR